MIGSNLTPADHPRVRNMVASVLIHALGIAVLLTIPSPEPLPVRFSRATPLVSPFRRPAPVTLRRSPTKRMQTLPQKWVRVFRPGDRLPQPLLLKAPIVLDPPAVQPSIHPWDTPTALMAPPIALQIAAPPPARVVKVAGFSSFDPAANSASAGAAHSEIAAGTFGDASAQGPISRTRQHNVSATSSAAEILSKPRPAYTEEARRMQLEGEVVLEVLFAASGQVAVMRTIQGLGHGLDQNAIAAAREIRFRPALRDGTPVDSTGVVHISFQLAY